MAQSPRIVSPAYASIPPRAICSDYESADPPMLRDDMTDWIIQLRDRLATREYCGINPGASEDDLRAFEKKFSVSLPDDMRRYLTLFNGMPENKMDGLTRFWPVEDIFPIATD